MRTFSSSSHLFPRKSSQLEFKRSLSLQFWKSSTPAATTVDPWPANLTSAVPDPVNLAPPVVSSIPAEPKIEADEFGYIPEPPAIPSDVPIEFYLNAAGEPALSTLELGKWYLPTGWVQQSLDYIHADIGLPWWATIMLGKIERSGEFEYSLHYSSIGIGTLVIRTLTVPVAIYNQRNAAQMQLHMPKLQELQGRLQEARIRNDQLASKKIILFRSSASMLMNSTLIVFSYESWQ